MRARPESPSTVWVSRARVRDALLTTVVRATEAARAEAGLWTAERTPAGAAPIVVSALEPGERRIPEEVSVLMSRVPEAGLLLLCTDELVRPTVALHGGRVLLLGPPLTEQRIGARLRVLLAERASTTRRVGVGEERVACTEGCVSHAYYALAGASGRGASPESRMPAVHQLAGGIAFTLRGASGEDEASEVRLRELLGRDTSDVQWERELLGWAGAEVAVVHLSTGREWLVHWPDPSWSLVLASPLRLPPAHRLAGGRAARLVRQPAASGDVLLAVWGSRWASPLGATPAEELTELSEAATAGGPGVLDALVPRLARAGAPVSALVMEVR